MGDGRLDVEIPARKSRLVHTVTLRDELAKHGADNVLVWLELEIDGCPVSDNPVAFVYPRQMKLVDPGLSATIAETPGNTEGPAPYTVTLTARHPALWAWLELDGLDARCSQNFVHVASFAPVSIRVRPATGLTKGAFQEKLRIRSLYDTYAH